MASYGADNRYSVNLIVVKDASTSFSVEFEGMRPVALITPVALEATTAVVQFWAGFNGSDPVVMTDTGGTEVEAVVVANAAHYIPLGNTDDAGAGADRFRGVNRMLIKLFASDGSTPVVQATASRAFTLILEKSV